MIDFVFIGTDISTKVIDNQYRIRYFNPFKFVDAKKFTTTVELDNMWHSKDKNYFDLLEAFFSEYKDVDVIVANWINPFHPEWLIQRFPKAIKIYGCIDDPVSTYLRTLNTIWAFDGVFYVSPGYDDQFTMNEFFDVLQIPSYWWPMSWGKVTDKHITLVQNSWKNRQNDLLYVGNLYAPKFERIVKLKKYFGNRFDIYGRWPLKGYAGLLLGPFKFFGKLGGCEKSCIFPYRIKSISEDEKTKMYLRHKISIDMHYSNKRETGNIRMYESVFHGTMLLCDKAAKEAHNIIFKPNSEAIYYDDINDGIEKAEYYLKNDEKREKIAKAGFERYCNDYDVEENLSSFLKWVIKVPIKNLQSNP